MVAVTQPVAADVRPALKILLSAYACEPNRRSEPSVGWNLARQISQYHRVWVMTRADRRDAVEAEILRDPLPNATFVYYSLPLGLDALRNNPIGLQFHYYLWQIGAYYLAQQLHKQVGFDIAHHVTYVKYWTPSFVSLLNVPFVWGPVGGAESTPRGFQKLLGLSGRVFEAVRNTVRRLAHIDPFVRLTARRAAASLAVTEDTAVELLRLRARNVSVLSAMALEPDEHAQLASLPFRTDGPFRLISIGRLLDWKGFHLGLMAFARFQHRCPDAEYWIVGDGPRKTALEQLARTLGIDGQVRFWGQLSFDETVARLAECDVLVHPSLHDSGGAVCMEAMAAGRPVLCLDTGGPGAQVTDQTGIKIPVTNPDDVVHRMADTMLALATDPALRRSMSEAARMHVDETFTWSAKGQFFADLYDQLAKVRAS